MDIRCSEEHDRVGRIGGGVAIYYESGVFASALDVSDEFTFTSSWVPNSWTCFTSDGSKILISVVYHSSKRSIIWSFWAISFEYAVTFPSCRMEPFFVHDIRNIDSERLYSSLSHANWDTLCDSSNIDNKIEIFNRYLLESINTSASSRRVSPKRPPALWMTCDINDIKKGIRKRNYLHKSSYVVRKKIYVRSMLPFKFEKYKGKFTKLPFVFFEFKRQRNSKQNTIRHTRT